MIIEIITVLQRRISMNYIYTILLGYLLGCSSMSYYLAKLNGIDIHSKGSKNLGASNTMMLMGWKAGILVGIHDIGKAALAVILSNIIFPTVPYIGAVAGVACVWGHIFPFYLKFKGGKGFASFLGMALAINWKFTLVLSVVVIIVTLVTDYIVVGTMTSIISFPAYMGFASQSYVLPLIILVASALIVYKHRENLVRIYHGTEIGFRSANRGDHRN